MSYHGDVEKLLRRDGWKTTETLRDATRVMARVWAKPRRYPVTVPTQPDRSDYRESIMQAYATIRDARVFEEE